LDKLAFFYQGFKPFKSSMGMLGAYATATRDAFDSHGQHTLDLQTADSELSEAVGAAVNIIDPDNSDVDYEHQDEDETKSLKANVAAFVKRLGKVTGVAIALNEAVAAISEKEEKMGEAITLATQMRLPAGDPAEHIAALVSVVAAVTGLLAQAKREVKGITRLPEELAKELYCIALSTDPKMASTLKDMDVRDESLTLPGLQVCL
jgi:hypothetical protein